MRCIRDRSLRGGPPLDDATLVEQARKGNIHAYENLVERYTEVAFRTAYLVAGSAADAQDAAQEAFIKAYYALSHFRAGAPFRPWLLQIVANQAKNRRRAAGRRENLSLRLAEGMRVGDAAPSPERALEAQEERRALLHAVNELREEDRLVIGCRYFLELSSEETAQTLGWPEGTVKSRLNRALGRLRERMVGERVADA